jgi:hypothetical protein
MYLTEKQKKSAHIFRESGILEKGKIAHLKSVNSYYQTDSIKSPAFIKELLNGSTDSFGPKWGGQLGSGAKVKIIDYVEFNEIPQLKGIVFINVYIVTDSE